MKCEKCGTEAFISAWDGWQYRCLNCDWIGRSATNEEIITEEVAEEKRREEKWNLDHTNKNA